MSSTLRGYIMTKARDIADGQSVDTTNFVTKSNGAIEALDGSGLTNLTSSELTGALPAISGASLTGIDAGGTNTPAFHAYMSANQSVSSGSSYKAAFNSTRFDTDSAFDTSNNRFVVPSGEAGVYVFQYWGKMNGIQQDKSLQVFLYKNGSEWNQQETRHKDLSPDTGGNEIHVHGSFTGQLAVDDYIEVYVSQNSGSSSNLMEESSGFTGFKLAE